MAYEKKYTLDETILYWEDRVLAIVSQLKMKECTLVEYAQLINNLRYAAYRLEVLNFAKIKQKPKTA